MRVDPRLLLGDPPLVDQALHERVVGRELGDLALAEQVGPAVADVPDRHPRPVEERDGRGGAGAVERGVLVDQAADRPVGVVQGGGDPADLVGAVRRRLVELSQLRDRGRGGDVAPRRAPDPVADGEQPWSGVPGVLVVLADPAHVGDRGVVEQQVAHRFPQLEDGLADPDLGSERDGGGLGDPDGADVGAVGGAEVLDEPLVAGRGDPGVPGRDVVVVELDRRVVAAADQDRRLGQAGGGPGVAALGDDDLAGRAAPLGGRLLLGRLAADAARRLGHPGTEHVGADHRDRGQHEDPQDREIRDPDQEERELRHLHPPRRSGRRAWCGRPGRGSHCAGSPAAPCCRPPGCRWWIPCRAPRSTGRRRPAPSP